MSELPEALCVEDGIQTNKFNDAIFNGLTMLRQTIEEEKTKQNTIINEMLEHLVEYQAYLTVRIESLRDYDTEAVGDE